MQLGSGAKIFIILFFALLLVVLTYSWFGNTVRNQVGSMATELSGSSASDNQVKKNPPHGGETAGIKPDPLPTAAVEPDSSTASATPGSLDEYRVVLGADEHMQIPGLPGELRVWIGSPDFNPDIPGQMVRDETNIPALGASARVQPYAPAFDVEPAKSQCIKLHPSGSEVRFRLTPKKSGTFKVGADVFLFDSLTCNGAPIPKTAATLKVDVVVNKKELVLDKTKQLWNVFWEQFLEFWAAFVALIFALILFLIRGGFNSEVHTGYAACAAM